GRSWTPERGLRDILCSKKMQSEANPGFSMWHLISGLEGTFWDDREQSYPWGFNSSGQAPDEVVSEQTNRLSVDLADPRLAQSEAGRNFGDAHVLVIVHGQHLLWLVRKFCHALGQQREDFFAIHSVQSRDTGKIRYDFVHRL